jgi:hypothetical protein
MNDMENDLPRAIECTGPLQSLKIALVVDCYHDVSRALYWTLAFKAGTA